MNGHIFKQIVNEDSSFSLDIIFCNFTVKLIVLENSNAWESVLNRSDLEQIAKLSKLKFDDYYEKLVNYLSEIPSGTDLIFSNGNFVVKITETSKFSFNYFTVKLSSVDYVKTTETLLAKFHNKLTETERELSEINEEKLNLAKQLEEYKQKLTELVETKKRKENEIFGQFLLVLNEKKRQIQHLTETFEAFKTTYREIEVKKHKNEKRAQPESISPSASEECSTEEEDVKEETVQFDDNEPGPSTSKTYSFLDDDEPRERLSLPKRLKSDIREAVPSTSASRTFKEEMNVKDDCRKWESDSDETIDFNTQELLNNML